MFSRPWIEGLLARQIGDHAIVRISRNCHAGNATRAEQSMSAIRW
jgi:hypothetical protein